MKNKNKTAGKTAEEITEEFFKKRFPDKDIDFEKKCGYFGEWIGRFESEDPTAHMDNESMEVWKEMQGITKRYKQIYTMELVTNEQYIDRSTEIQTALEENPVFSETEINVDLQSYEEEEGNWTEDDETEFKCEKCGHEWKLKESVECPKCEKGGEEDDRN